MAKKNLPGAIETAKRIVKHAKEQVDEAEKLLVSLELEHAIPEIWDHGDSFKITGERMKGKLSFVYPDGFTVWVPLHELPDSYLAALHKKNHQQNTTIVKATENEIWKRRRAKRKEEMAKLEGTK